MRPQVKILKTEFIEERWEILKMGWIICYIVMCIAGVSFFWEEWEEIGEIKGWKGIVAYIVFFVAGGIWLMQATTIGVLVLLGWKNDDYWDW